ncbi:hypothetical protein [Streptomyces sp. WAC 04229]|uniref:hypothetical protein n=1 Tax=Streptomyces sp. WAC 04229 TaxID=2203206 RepID=UPI003D761F66
MTDLIGRLVVRLGLLPKPRGTHRRTGAHPAVRTAPHRPATTGVASLPSHRSPYGSPSVLDGAETVAVRPYVLAYTSYELEAAA